MWWLQWIIFHYELRLILHRLWQDMMIFECSQGLEYRFLWMTSLFFWDLWLCAWPDDFCKANVTAWIKKTPDISAASYLLHRNNIVFFFNQMKLLLFESCQRMWKYIADLKVYLQNSFLLQILFFFFNSLTLNGKENQKRMNMGLKTLLYLSTTISSSWGLAMLLPFVVTVSGYPGKY